MRLQPVQLLDDLSGHANRSTHSSRGGFSRRALIAAVAGGGAVAGLAAWSGAGTATGAAEAPAHDAAPGGLDPLDRLTGLPGEDLLHLHQAVVFAAFTAATDDPRVDRLADRLLDAVLASGGSVGHENHRLRAHAATSLTTLARLRGGPTSLVAALPQLEAIR